MIIPRFNAEIASTEDSRGPTLDGSGSFFVYFAYLISERPLTALSDSKHVSSSCFLLKGSRKRKQNKFGNHELPLN